MSSLDKKPRLKNPIRKKPYFENIAPGVSLGYRRSKGAGAWIVRAADGNGSNWSRGFATADDFEESNQKTVLKHTEALDEARRLARASGAANTSDNGRPITVFGAIDKYEKDLMIRGARKVNATMIRCHMTKKLGEKAVALTTDNDFVDWRNDLITESGIETASADRVGRSLKAALNLAARSDKRIANSAEWRNGLTKLPDAGNARNVILPDDVVLAIVRTAYDIAEDSKEVQLGIWCHVLAETGNREGQIRRVEVLDLQTDRKSPRLMVPSSKKGKNRQVTRKPLPITLELASKLKELTIGKRPHDALLTPIKQLSVKFKPVTARLKLDKDVTPYALRHSSIVRQLLKGIPTRLVASAHDTSVAEIERTYSRYIVSDHTEAMLRDTLLISRVPATKIVKLVA
jgi:integrase